jgi:hypothetical protein
MTPSFCLSVPRHQLLATRHSAAGAFLLPPSDFLYGHSQPQIPGNRSRIMTSDICLLTSDFETVKSCHALKLSVNNEMQRFAQGQFPNKISIINALYLDFNR